MTVEKMRARLCEVYNGPKWRLRIQAMEDRQVVAIYKSMQREGRFEKKAVKPKKKEPGIKRAVQLTIFDFM